MKSIPVLIVAAWLAGAAPLGAQSPADPPGLMGLDAATTKLIADTHASARSEVLESMLRIARNAQLAAMERNPPDFAGYINAMEVEKTISANLLARRLNADLDAYAKMTPEQRRAVVAANRRLMEETAKMREQQRQGR
jgi:hypothetical protein